MQHYSMSFQTTRLPLLLITLWAAGISSLANADVTIPADAIVSPLPDGPLNLVYLATDSSGQPVRMSLAQQQYLNATLDQRITIAESLGERGANEFAKKNGYESILTAEQKSLRQGFDQVYRAPDGRIVVVEAKGGTSPLGHGYGAEQGTTEWAVKAARATLNSTKASNAEQVAAQTVLEAAEQGNLTVQVIRTRHVLGEPVAAVLESSKTVTATERVMAAEFRRSSHQVVANLQVAPFNTEANLIPQIARRSSSSIKSQISTKEVAIVLTGTPETRSIVSRVVRAPGIAAGGMTFAIDSGIEVYKYWDGQTNKTELAEGIQDALLKASVVGTSVQVLYLLAATPQGMVVMGVAIVSYIAADAIISHIREEYGSRYMKIKDLQGIAPKSFLDNLEPTLADIAKGAT